MASFLKGKKEGKSAFQFYPFKIHDVRKGEKYFRQKASLKSFLMRRSIVVALIPSFCVLLISFATADFFEVIYQ